MKNKFKLLSICAAIFLSMLLTGCSENNQPNTSGNSSLNSQNETTNSSPENSKTDESSDTGASVEETLSINSDVVWGLGKTLDELKGKFGEIRGGVESMGIYTFENGYGRYVVDVDEGVCTQIDGINTSNMFKGSFSVLNYEELKARAGITYWHIDGDDPAPLDNCWWAFFTHPDYSGVTFSVYSQTARDEIKADVPGARIWLSDPESLVGPSDYRG